MPTLHTGLMAGAPCPEELCKAVVDELGMKDFVVAYGMTETSPVTFQGFPDDDMLLKTSTVGYPMDHQEVKVVDSQGKTVVRCEGQEVSQDQLQSLESCPHHSL